MRLSVIIAVLESYEIVKRQLLYFAKMNLPEYIQFIILDDGSKPPLISYPGMSEALVGLKNSLMYETKDERLWSQPCARNTGAKISSGRYLLFTDIDHIFSKEAILDAYHKEYDKMDFTRQWAVLDREGNLSQDVNTLYAYGLPELLHKERGLNAGRHSNTFGIKREIFLDMLKGYDERYCGRYGNDDVDFGKRYSHLCRQLKLVEPCILGRPIYVYPDPRKDIKDIFHNIRKLYGRVEREDPICPECNKMYRYCKCYYPDERLQ